ncbi:hypothetical protein Rhopal_002199-T1 [Rhodotorula paludigena]|uniref:Xylanolytic transcriptional activator regulatory domain-containing protein n=1 Tax=Rhodotorula paludigena TaxID=86838 RepID=A0AAV5GIB9_9BASI|nr:hypothetical protein Rhopal_002199-T1 [Rhodotorula paludigena]
MAKRTQRDDDLYTPGRPAQRSRQAHSAGGSTGESSKKAGRGAVACLDNLEDLPSRQLKRKVDRLEEIIASLAAGRAVPPSPAVLSPSPSPEPARAASKRVSVSSKTGSPAPAGNTRRAKDAVVDALTRALLSASVTPDVSSLVVDAAALTNDLRIVEDQHVAPLPFYTCPTPESFHDVVSAEEFDKTVTAVLPSMAQAQLALSSFFMTANRLLHLVHPSIFLAQCDVFWRTGTVPEQTWLATYFIVCGIGLLVAPDASLAQQHVVPSGPAKELLARTWMDAGRRVLVVNRFLEQPTIEGIRAFCIFLQWFPLEGGRHLQGSLALTATVIAAAYDLQLNRDPSEVAPHLSPLEANQRRRLFWSLYTYDAVIRPILGRAWQPFDAEDISVAFPLDSIAGEPAAPGPSPVALYQAAVHNFRISRLLARGRTPTIEEISSILDELEKFLAENADNSVPLASARSSYCRLHRFAASAGLTTESQDFYAAQCFTALLQSVDSPELAHPACAALVLLRVFSTSIAAAVDLNEQSYVMAGADPYNHQLFDLLRILRTRMFPSQVHRLIQRAVVIIEHLLPRPDEPLQLGPSFCSSDSVSEYSLDSSKLPTPSTAGFTPDGFAVVSDLAVLQAAASQVYASPELPALPAPVIPPVVAALQQAAMMPPPVPAVGRTEPPVLRTSRPALSVFTTVAPPAPATKALTPLVSPWIDAAITPSRYAGDWQWDGFA